MNVNELRDERGKLETRMRELLDRAEAENRDLTQDEDGQFKALHEKDSEFRTRIERQEKLDAIAKANEELRSGSYRKDELPQGSAVGNDPTRNGERRSDADLVLEGWALRSLGGKTGTHHHEAAKRLGTDIYLPHHDIALYGNRELRQLQQSRWEGRASTTVTGADVIPTDFIAQLERAMLAYGGVLAVADQFRTAGGNPVVVPTVDDTANSGGDSEEGTSGDDATDFDEDPTFSKVTFGAFKTSSMIRYSTELEEDAGFDLSGELANLLGERIARTLNARCTNGNGSTQAQGIVTGSSLGHTALSATELESDDILTLIHSVNPAYRSAPGVGFLMNDAVLLAVRKMKDEEGRYVWQPSLQLGTPDRLCNYPVHISQDMASSLTANAKVMLFGDLRKHRVRMVRGVRLVVARELYAETDEIAILAHLRYDSKLMQSAAVKHLKMASS